MNYIIQWEEHNNLKCMCINEKYSHYVDGKKQVCILVSLIPCACVYRCTENI